LEQAMRDHSQASHADKVLSVLNDDLAPARSIVAASWQRSLTLYGLDPAQACTVETLTEQQLKQARLELDPLLNLAQATLDRLFQAVGAAGCCVLLTNRDGVPIDRRSEPVDDKAFYAAGLWTGTVWSEAAQGTNGIGTCLAEGRALTIHRDQHFRACNVELSCSVAPIYDHQGRLAASLDVSSWRSDLTDGLVGLIAAAVADAARTIEAQHFRQAFARNRIVLASDSDRQSNALIAVDSHDLVVGATRAARLSLGITDARIAAQLPAADVLALQGSENFQEAQRGVIMRALARASGNVSAAAKALSMSRATLHRKLNRLGIIHH
jgi:transcriptional regulator of acetoin/glycerol metabolism